MSTIISLYRELIAELVRKVDSLDDQIYDLKLALRFDAVSNVQAAFGISESLARMLVVLSDGKSRTKEQLHAGLYFERPEADAPEVKILDTLASKLRKCIEPYGVQLTTIWSGGYQITGGLDVLRAAMDHAILDVKESAVRRKRERERERQKRLRAARGCPDRQTYEAALPSRLRPWEAEGISRATWYRRTQRRAEIGASRANDNSPVSHGIRRKAA
jgi:hypothetical protein